MNKDTDYEKLAQEIYQTLINNQSLTIDVQHNKKIKGKASEHQIDVYWEYNIAGVTHKVAIECKNYNSSIPIGKVRDFYAVLSDIGNINGIMVTKKGYQRGAKEFAEHYGINLMIIRKPIKKDWHRRTKTINIDMQMTSHNVTERQPLIDEEWARANFKEEELKDLKAQIEGKTDEIWIIDSNDKKIKNFHQLENELPIDNKETTELKYFFTFDDGYILTNNIGKVKLKGVRFTYNVNIKRTKIVIDGQKFAKAIMKDALSGKIVFLDKNGTIK